MMRIYILILIPEDKVVFLKDAVSPPGRWISVGFLNNSGSKNSKGQSVRILKSWIHRPKHVY